MIRDATLADVPGINALITGYAERGLMLFRSLAELYEKIRQFVVFEEPGGAGGPSLLGCCALEVVWRDLAEVKSLAVRHDAHGRGIGRKLVEAVQADAARLGVERLFALTREQEFFERLGYQVVPKEILPHKVWSDCIKCPRLANCDEVAVCKPLNEAGASRLTEAIEWARTPRSRPSGENADYEVFHG